MEINHKMFSAVILLLLLIQEGLLSVKRDGMHCALLSLPRKKVVRLTNRLDMTIAVDWDVNRKPNKTNRSHFI